jgi:hypothetical protein
MKTDTPSANPLTEVSNYLRQHRVICLEAGDIPAADLLDENAKRVEAARDQITQMKATLLAIENTTGNDEYKAMIRAALGLPKGDPV